MSVNVHAELLKSLERQGRALPPNEPYAKKPPLFVRTERVVPKQSVPPAWKPPQMRNEAEGKRRRRWMECKVCLKPTPVLEGNPRICRKCR